MNRRKNNNLKCFKLNVIILVGLESYQKETDGRGGRIGKDCLTRKKEKIYDGSGGRELIKQRFVA